MLTEIKNSKSKDTLTIEYMLGNLCNHRCSYCFPGSNEGNFPWPNVNLVIKNLDHLLSKYIEAGKTKFEFYLIGGEPTLWKELPILCDYLTTNYDVKIRISTNGSRGIEWWTKNAKYFDEVEISVHHEFADIDHLMQVADVIYKQRINLVANVLMDPDAFDKCKGIVEQLRDSQHRWLIIAKPVHFNGSTRYTSEQEEYLHSPIKRYPNPFWWFTLKHNKPTKIWAIEDYKYKHKVKDNYFMLHDLNHFKGWMCNLGLDHINIAYDGIISGNCGQKLYGDDYYNLYHPGFTTLFNPAIGPVVCSKKTCVCTQEIKINKRL